MPSAARPGSAAGRMGRRLSHSTSVRLVIAWTTSRLFNLDLSFLKRVGHISFACACTCIQWLCVYIYVASPKSHLISSLLATTNGSAAEVLHPCRTCRRSASSVCQICKISFTETRDLDAVSVLQYHKNRNSAEAECNSTTQPSIRRLRRRCDPVYVFTE